MTVAGKSTDLVWYASYGSNMASVRFAVYLNGGTPEFALRSYPGARDKTPPRATKALRLPGQVYFAHESSVWGGGVAFLDTGVSDAAPSHAYLVTLEQFCDVAAQEMHRVPGSVRVDMDEIARTGSVLLGPGRYERLVLGGYSEGFPVLTFTAPSPIRPLNVPSPHYLRLVAGGLRASHGWSTQAASVYLASLPGSGRTAQAVRQLIDRTP